jgi:hypothetical protein
VGKSPNIAPQIDGQPRIEEGRVTDSCHDNLTMDDGPVRPWDENVELVGHELGKIRLNLPRSEGSAASHSSVINDYGDAEHLAENRKSGHPDFSSDSRVSTGELVLHSGAGFVNTQEEITQVDKTGLVGPEDQLPEEETVGGLIRAAFQTSAVGEDKKKFLPIDSLERIVTKKRIRRELKDLVPTEKLERVIDEIWDLTPASPSKSSTKYTTRRKIFAILALMESTGNIVYFIKENLHDNDLPLILSDGSRPEMYRRDRRTGLLQSIQLFAAWPAHELEYFDINQWKLLAPYFVLNTKDNPKVKHYNLPERITLPFIEENEVRREGGFSDVWKVKISPGHHNYRKDWVSLSWDRLLEAVGAMTISNQSPRLYPTKTPILL